MTDLHYPTAAGALRLFRARELSPVELVSAVIERAEAIEPAINAFAETFYEQALDQARTAEARYAGRGGAPPLPLDGLPVAVKEEAEIAGSATRSVRCRCATPCRSTSPAGAPS